MNHEVWKDSCIITPSLICLDMCNLESQIKLLEKCGIQMLHIDILDGHFSPSMPLGLETVRQLRKVTDMEFEVHLMVTENDYFVNELLDIGVSQIVFHAEIEPHIDGLLNRIHSKGVRAGVALKPSTSLSVLDYVLDKCDTVLLMLINPGYASSAAEAQVSYADTKVRQLRKMINERGFQTKIELDGRISPQNIKDYGNGIAEIFVAGSTCIKKGAIAESIKSLHEIKNSFR